MKLTLTHTLTCSLPSPPRLVAHLLLTARSTPQQKVERWSIEMPGFPDCATFRDGFGNTAHFVSQAKPGETVSVTVTGTVETIDRAGVLGRLEFDPPAGLYRRQTPLTAPDPTILAAVAQSDGRIAMLHDLMARIGEHFGTPSQSQSDGGQSQTSGSADAAAHAHAFVGIARALDIPARYVTGYLLAEDGTATAHAWAEALDDGLGWIGFDPLLDLCPTDHHIRLAAGLDSPTTTPLRMVPTGSNTTETVQITAA